jgi:hypothetical protein
MNRVLTAYHSLPSTDQDWMASIHSHRTAVWIECGSAPGRTFQDELVKGLKR